MAKKRLTIGLLINSLEYEYQVSIWAGVNQIAREADANVVSFAGTEINSPDLFRNARNTVYDMVSKHNVDGIILAASTVLVYVNPGEIKDYLDKYKDIPLVSIGMNIPDVPSIIMDNIYGFKFLVDHLIERHGYRKFLYIGGPGYNIEAIERLNAFKESLSGHQIGIDPENIKTGDFTFETGYNITAELIKVKKEFDFDSIVAASDNMAMGTIKALQKNNIMVPRDVAVVGYDDIKNAASLIPPLTTVRQPVLEMAKRSMKMLLDIINGKTIYETELIKTQPVIRRSCGCIPHNFDNIAAAGIIPDQEVLPDADKLKEMIDRGKEPAIPGYESDYMEPVIGAFIKFVNDEITESRYIAILEENLIGSGMAGTEAWDELILFLRKKVLPYFTNKSDMLIKIEDAVHKSRKMIFDVLKQMETDSEVSFMEKTRILQQAMRRLVISFNVETLWEKMTSELPLLGIKSCYLSLHSSPEKLFKEARLIFAYDRNGRIKLDKDGYLYPCEQLLPADLIKREDRYDLILELLVYESEQLGFILFELNPLEGLFVTSMSDQIRSAIKASMMMQDIAEKGKKLEKTVSELNENTLRLETTFEKLKENQQKLLLSEKMASLGRLSSGIAHEMNSPLSAVRASLTELMNLIAEYRKSLNDPQITINDHIEITNDMTRSMAIANKAIDKSIGFLKGIKDQTREMDRNQGVVFNIIEIINETLLLVNHALKRNQLSIIFNYSRNPIELYGNPGKIAQIITNLVTNASDAMENNKGGTITIDLKDEESGITLSVIDKGCGIPEENLKKIFDPLFTTKPFAQGTGLGLSIVHDIVYDDFKGIIEVKSKVNSGTEFRIIFNKMRR